MKLLIVALVFTFAVVASAVEPIRSESEFYSKLQDAGNKLVVIDFFAVWCNPCKVIAPSLDEFAKTYADKIVIVKVDVDQFDDLMEKYNVRAMPTFVFLKNGRQVETFAGADKGRIENTIRRFAEIEFA